MKVAGSYIFDAPPRVVWDGLVAVNLVPTSVWSIVRVAIIPLILYLVLR